MLGILVLPIVALALAGVLVVLGRRAASDYDQDATPESADWRRTVAEVISVLRTRDHTFVLVRYRVGTSLIHNDLVYSLTGPVPHAGQRLRIKYDPWAPAHIAIDDQHRRAGDPASRPITPASMLPRTPAAKPGTAASSPACKHPVRTR